MNSHSRELTIAFLLETDPSRGAHPRVSSVTDEVLQRLREKGAEVDLIVPEARSWDLSSLYPTHDLYVLKSETPLALSLAGALAIGGAEVVNTFRSVSLARDKVAATAVLAASGVPVPRSYATGQTPLLLPLLEEGPLWLKPQRGTKGAGVKRITLAEELDAQGQNLDPYGLPLPIFAQAEAPSSGRDLKVYVVGDNVWGIARRFPAFTDTEKAGQPSALSERISNDALLCGKALGLELYGVDFLLSGDHVAVVDINAFPGYKGVAEAPEALAEYIHRRALAARDRKGAWT